MKVAVVARHGVNRNIAVGFVKGFGLERGALASSVGHDSHNICVVGVNEGDMAVAVNRLIAIEGGFAVVAGGQVLAELALPMAGLMSLQPKLRGGARGARMPLARRREGPRLRPVQSRSCKSPSCRLPVIPHPEDHR